MSENEKWEATATEIVHQAIEQGRKLCLGPWARMDHHTERLLIEAIEKALAAAAQVQPGHVRTEDGEFNLWSTLRQGLTYCRDDLQGMVRAESHEAYSAHADAVARTLTSHAIGTIRKEINEAEAALKGPTP